MVVGNGKAYRGKGICQAVVVVLLELMVTEDLLPFELGRVDIILGIIWLCNMGYMEVHWPSLTMTFMISDRKITLKGDASLTATEVTLKTLTHRWEEEDMGSLVEFQHMEPEIEEEKRQVPIGNE